MKAVGVIEYGGPEALQLVELPTPEAGSGQVRVQVHAAAINPADVMLRDGSLADWYKGEETPFIPGMDIAGVIDQIGPDVDPALGLEIGQPVTSVVDNRGQYGGYSQYLTVPAQSVIRAPRNVTIEEAAAFLMPALTARTVLDTLQLASSDTVLVSGAAGGVGRYAVALAHADDLRVIAVAGVDDAQTVTGLGADVVINRDENISARVEEITPVGVDAVIDTTTSPDLFLPTLRDGGNFLSPRGISQHPGRGITVLSANVRDRVLDTPAIGRLRDLVEAGVLPTDVEAAFPAEQAVAAHERFEQGHIRGRFILTFSH